VSLRKRALGLLARREHSRAELARKLSAHAEADEITTLLDQLEQEGLLSNSRYAESLANARLGRHGSRRLKAELEDKGVPAAVVAEVILGARENDLESARAVWAKKFGRLPADAVERARQMRFMAGRGFPADVVRRVLGGEDD
jgi:regulatory protein